MKKLFLYAKAMYSRSYVCHLICRTLFYIYNCKVLHSKSKLKATYTQADISCLEFNKPVSQSYAAAKSEKFWWATGQSNLAYKRLLTTTKIFQVWLSYSHNCTLANGAVFILSAKFDCPVASQNFSPLATAHDLETGL